MLLLASLLASIAYGASAVCPVDFELAYKGECHIRDSQLNMAARNGSAVVQSMCAAYGAQPVTINSQEEHDYWLSVARKDRTEGGDESYGNVALGIKCSAQYHHYKWFDGSDIDFYPEGTDPTLVTIKCEEEDGYCMWYINPDNGAWTKVCQATGCSPTRQYVDVYCVIPHVDKSIKVDEECQEFDNDEDDRVCYQVGAAIANWTEANNACRGFGASLASIHNEKENSFVRCLAASRGLVNGLMLGAIGNGENNFTWNDRSTWDYDNFAPGFPIAGLGDCIAMESNIASGPWMNLDCATKLPFACARKQNAPAKCDGAVHRVGDIMVSPGFPANSSTSCDYILAVDPGMLVEVEILVLEANSCCDHLILSEGPMGGAVIEDLTGDAHNGRKFRTTTQNYMRVSWQPRGGVNVKGMMITYTAVPKS